MFEGSAHHDHGYFPPLQDAGAALNGSTNADRTNYWEVVPTGALELALWLESDRMGYLLPALTEEKFDTQRDVVLNERRQNYENRPYGLAGIAIADGALSGAITRITGRPSATRRTCAQATLDDVRDFFARHYHPGNASLALAGDIDPARALALVERYFGDLPAGPPVPRVPVPGGGLSGETRIVLEDRVELAAALPGVAVAGAVRRGRRRARRRSPTCIASGKTSRLYRTLVHERRLALDVSAAQQSRELEGFFQLAATAAPGRTLDRHRGGDQRGARRARRDRADRRRARARAGPGRGQLRLSPADGRRLQRQVGSAERLQRLPRQSRARSTPTSRATRRLTAADVRDACRRLATSPRVALSVVPHGRRRSGARRLGHGGGVVSAPPPPAGGRRLARHPLPADRQAHAGRRRRASGRSSTAACRWSA